MNKKRRWPAVLMLLTIIFLLSSCKKEADTPDENAVVFTDALGRSVTIARNPERVAALIGSFADVWLLSGGTVSATAEDAWSDFGLTLPDAVNIGGAHSPNTELLFASDPDFVIASASTASNISLCEVLEEAKIPVAYFDVDNFDDYLKMLDILTDITGRKDLYQKNGLIVKEQIERIKKEISDYNLPEDKRTVLLLRASSGFVKAKGSQGTILGEMLSDVGLINIADGDNALLESLSVESVIRLSPYRIFVVTMGDDTEKALSNLNRLMSENPAWGLLDAVQQGRLHLMDRRLFNIKPNAEWAESYEELKNILLEKE